MFGKNKKNKTIKTEEVSSQPIIHTMQDDLNINIEGVAEENFSDNSVLEKTNSPFAGDVSSEKESVGRNDISKPEINSATPQMKKDSPFSGVPSQDPPPAVAKPEPQVDLKPKMETFKSPVSQIKKDPSPIMPKSVNDLTTAVDKDDSSDEKEEEIKTETSPEIVLDGNDGDKMLPEKAENEGKSKIFVYATIIFLIVAIGVGGYFVWDSKYIDINSVVTKKDDTQPSIFTEEPEIVIEGEDENNENTMEEFEFSEEVNFLTVENINLNKTGLEGIIKQKFLEMNNYSGNLLEFVAVNESNEPLKFSEFALAFELSLPRGITEQLSEDFTIYLYKNGVIEKMGIAVKTVGGDAALANLERDEAYLVEGLNSLLLGGATEEELMGKTFKSSTYNDLEVRFTNLNDTSSIDYAIVSEYLLFATSKDSGRAMMDKIKLDESAMDSAIMEDGVIDNTTMTDDMVIPTVEGAETSLNDGKTKDIFNESSASDNLEDGETMIEV